MTMLEQMLTAILCGLGVIVFLFLLVLGTLTDLSKALRRTQSIKRIYDYEWTEETKP